MTTDLNRASIYVPITSITKADDGRTRIVTGVAASDRLDYDGQRASYDWFKKELSSWFKVGNMRQDHRAGGVGKAISLEFDDKAKTATVVSKAVDPDTILKLDEQVLNGYSWGAKSVPGNPIRIRKDAGGVEWIESGKVVEVSYVDHPANPDCFVSLVKSVGKRGLQRTKVLGDLADTDIPGGQDWDAILKALLADIEKRDVSAAERERLGDQGHAIDTGQDHPSYPIANPTDLKNAISAYGRANPEDRAKLRRHIISEAKRLGRSDMIPDGWKSVDALLKQSMAGCGCCDDCGPDCQGDCCDTCRQMAGKAVAPGPAGILAGVKALVAAEPDQEYQGFLGKLATAVDGWSRTEGVSVDLSTYATLAGLSKASTEPDLAKRRTFYSTANRADVEQAMQSLHQALGIFMEGASSTDLDKDQRDNTLTGQDAPDPGNQPGGPGTAPHDGVPGDGNLNFDPSLVRDGDPAVRTPDGQRDGRAQGEAGTHTWPPAGDAPRGQVAPSKAAKRLKKAKAKITELRKAAAGQNGQPAIALQQTLSPTGQKRKGRTKDLRREVKQLGAELRKALADQAHAPQADQTRVAETVAAAERRFMKAMSRLEKSMTASQADQTRPLQEQIDALGKAIAAAAAARPAGDTTPPSIDSSLLLADLTRAAYEQTRKDLGEQATWLAKQVKRAGSRQRKAAQADRKRLDKLASNIDELGRRPAPGGPQIARPTDKTFPINDSVERKLSPDLVKRVETLNELAKSSDRQTAADARATLRELMAEVRG